MADQRAPKRRVLYSQFIITIALRIITSLIFLVFSGLVFAQEESSIPQEKRLDYAENLEENIKYIEEGQHSKELYMNLGYAYYQDGDLANAVLYYEKALKLAPLDSYVKTSLAQIRAELPIQVSDIPDFILVRAYRSVSNLMSAATWSIIQLIFGLMFLYGLYQVLLKGVTMKRTYSWTLLGVLLVLSLICGLMSYHSKLVEDGGDQAISMVDQELYKAADERSESVVTIGPGNKVFLLDTIGDWYKVQLRDKDTGWVKKEKVRLI